MTVLRDYIGASAIGPHSRWVSTYDGYAPRSSPSLDLRSSRASMLGVWDELASLHLTMEHTTSPTEMFQALDSSLDNLRDCIRDELPEFVVMMIYLLRFTWPGHPILLQMFRKHVGELSFVLLGAKHPLAVIWRQAIQIEEGFDDVVEEICHVLFQELAASLGPTDDVVELARRGWRYAPNSLEGMVEVMRLYQDWLASHQNWPSSMLRSFLVQVRLMIANLNETTPSKQLLEAHNTIQTILYTRGKEGEIPISPDESCSLANLDGGVSLRLGNFVEAGQSFSMAVAIARRHRLPFRDEIIPLRNLEALYRAMDKRAELAQISRELAALEERALQETGLHSHIQSAEGI